MGVKRRAWGANYSGFYEQRCFGAPGWAVGLRAESVASSKDLRGGEVAHQSSGPLRTGPRRPLQGEMACKTSPPAASNPGHLNLPVAAFSNSPEAKRWFAAPNTFHACKASAKNLVGPNETNARPTAKKLHLNWGHASVFLLQRILTDADGLGATALNVMGSVVDECDVGPAAAGKAPRLPAAGALLVSALSEKVQVGFLFPGNLIALHATDLFSRYAMRVSASLGNPLDVWGAFVASWINVSGKPRCLQSVTGGGWENDVWAHLRSGRDIRLQSQGRGALPWKLERREGLAHSVYKLHEDGRSVDKAILNEAQYCCNAALRPAGFPAHQMAFGSNPVDPFSPQNSGAGLDFAQNAFISSRFRR